MSIVMNCCRGSWFCNARPRHRSSRASSLPQWICAQHNQMWERACPRWRPPRQHIPSLIHRQKKPRSSRDRIGAEEGTVEEPLREGDQTFVKPAESSVPTLSSAQVSRKRPVHRYCGHCDKSPLPPPRAPTRIEPRHRSLKKDCVMMHADLIDQEDLLGQLKSLGFEVPSWRHRRAGLRVRGAGFEQ